MKGRALTGMIAAGLAAVACAIAAAPADAAKKLVYRDPASYKGVTRAPKTKAPPKPPMVQLSTTGQFPDVLVDEAGTAHIVWNEPRGDQADAAMYCRLKRGAKTCDVLRTLLWNKSYGPGDGPQFNNDYFGPKIVRVGDQLVVLSRRYPTSPSVVVAWTSLDGGNSWSTPEHVGTINLGQLVVLGPETDPTILNLSISPGGCKFVEGASAACLQAYKSGEFSAETEPLGTGEENYYPSLTLDRGRPLASFNSLSYYTVLRRWTGVGSPLDRSRWTKPTKILHSIEPQVAGGPSGAWLLDRNADTGSVRIRRVTSASGGIDPAPPTRLSADGDNSMLRLTVDPSDGLHSLWTRRDYGSDGTEGVYLAESGAGALEPATKLVGGNSNGQTAVGAALDGGGFALFNRTGGLSNPGKITAAAYGPLGPTGKKGISGVPGGGNKSCGLISFGQFDLKAAAGCFLFGTGANSRVAVTGGEVRVNGLRIVPDAGVKIILDPKDLQIDTTGAVRVMVSNASIGDIVLFRGAIHRDIFKVAPNRPLFEFPSLLFKANVLGFDVGANIRVYLKGTGVRIPIDVKLPAGFGGFTGHAELFADNSGLRLDSLHIHIGPVPLGALVIRSIDIDYSGLQDRWVGDGELTVPPGGTLRARVEFLMGELDSALIELTPNPPITIGPFVYLLQVRGGFRVDPVQIKAGASLGAGAAIQGKAPVKVNGDFTMTFPKGAPGDFHLDGTVELFLFQIGSGYLDFKTNGYATFGGHTGFSAMVLGTGFNLNADLAGFVDARSGRFGARLDGSAEVCMWFGVPLCTEAGIKTALSDVGIALCGEFTVPFVGKKTGGIRYPWKDFNPIYLQNPVLFIAQLVRHVRTPCNTDGYYLAPPSRAPAPFRASSTQVSVRSGLPSATILVEGKGGRPDVTVTGPGGVTINTSTRKGGYVTGMNGIAAEYVVLDKPRGGTYTITPNAGSKPIKDVLLSDGYKEAKVSAKLGRKGSKRTIAYRISNLGHGQSVTFAERGAFGTRLIKTVESSSGRVRFKPAEGKGGRRTVLAFVEQRGFATDTKEIGHYRAPGPSKPGPVRKLAAKRKGTNLTVRWKPARRAATYVVKVKGSKGTRLGSFLQAKTRRVRFKAIRRDERFKVTVQAFSKSFRAGPIRKVVIRAG